MFPSLLEIASATPLESMYLGTPVLVADIPSMRTGYGDMVGYFNPWNPVVAAGAIGDELKSESLVARVAKARMWARSQGSPQSRAREYLQIMLGG